MDHSFKFNLYELTSDSAVQCYVSEEFEPQMRSLWGRIADVSGIVKRDVNTDLPVEIRSVTSIDVVEEGDPDGYLRARGVLRTTEPAEVLIRCLRDGDCPLVETLRLDFPET